MTNRLIAVIGMILVFMDMISFAVRAKKRGIRTELKEDRKFVIREVLIYLCSVLIIALVFLLEFGTLGDAVLCGSSVLGAELANRELLNVDD